MIVAPGISTIARLLHDATAQLAGASIDDGRLEAELLLAHALAADRAHVLARLSDAIDDHAHARFSSLLSRRVAHEPLAYIVVHREFYGVDIECAPGALIPRPETEMLVEIALGELRARSAELRIADVGTGSGAIAVAVAANAPSARITAVDASSEALAIARRNVERNGVADCVELHRGNLLNGAGRFDVIVANLPYISAAEWHTLQPEIRDHEPREALVGGISGTEVIEQLLRDAPPHLANGGVLAAEIGATQGTRVSTAARASFPSDEVCVIKDVAGLDRVLVVRTRGG